MLLRRGVLLRRVYVLPNQALARCPHTIRQALVHTRGRGFLLRKEGVL